MMGIGHAEATRLPFWDYQALLWNWNDRHTTGDDGAEVEAPEIDFMLHRQQMLADRGIGKMVH